MFVCIALGPMRGRGEGITFLATVSLILIISGQCQEAYPTDISFKILKLSCVRGLFNFLSKLVCH